MSTNDREQLAQQRLQQYIDDIQSATSTTESEGTVEAGEDIRQKGNIFIAGDGGTIELHEPTLKGNGKNGNGHNGHNGHNGGH